jgi:hypothetical protein
MAHAVREGLAQIATVPPPSSGGSTSTTCRSRAAGPSPQELQALLRATKDVVGARAKGPDALHAAVEKNARRLAAIPDSLVVAPVIARVLRAPAAPDARASSTRAGLIGWAFAAVRRAGACLFGGVASLWREHWGWILLALFAVLVLLDLGYNSGAYAAAAMDFVCRRMQRLFNIVDKSTPAGHAARHAAGNAREWFDRAQAVSDRGQFLSQQSVAPVAPGPVTPQEFRMRQVRRVASLL